MTTVRFEDNSEDVKRTIEKDLLVALIEVANEIKSQAARNSPVDTGQLKNSWNYEVNESELEAKIGSPEQNAIWNEYGTGQYALHGDGRKDVPWVYRGNDGKYYATSGKKPKRSLYKAFIDIKGKIEDRFAINLKNLK